MDLWFVAKTLVGTFCVFNGFQYLISPIEGITIIETTLMSLVVSTTIICDNLCGPIERPAFNGVVGPNN